MEAISDARLALFNASSDILTQPRIPIGAPPVPPVTENGRLVYEWGEPVSINLAKVLVDNNGDPKGDFCNIKTLFKFSDPSPGNEST